MPNFTPRTYAVPMVEKPMRPADTLWGRMTFDRTYAVLKTGSSYREVMYPTAEEIAAADIAYLGGHTYVVSSDEAAALNAAGYTTT